MQPNKVYFLMELTHPEYLTWAVFANQAKVDVPTFVMQTVKEKIQMMQELNERWPQETQESRLSNSQANDGEGAGSSSKKEKQKK